MKELSFDKLYVKFSNLYCEYRSRKQFLKWLKSSKNLSEELFEVTPSEGGSFDVVLSFEEIKDVFPIMENSLPKYENDIKQVLLAIKEMGQLEVAKIWHEDDWGDVLEENVDEKYFFSDDLLCKEKFISNEWKEPMSAAIRTRSEGKWIKGEKHSSKVELGKNIANTITSASKDSLVVLGETRLRIRRLTPRELFRLMNVDEEYIDKMLESGVSKSSLQKAAGNSIVVACMERIFKELWFSESNVKVADDGQLCLF